MRRLLTIKEIMKKFPGSELNHEGLWFDGDRGIITEELCKFGKPSEECWDDDLFKETI